MYRCHFNVASFSPRTWNDFKTFNSAKKGKSVSGRSATPSGAAPLLGPTQTPDLGRALVAAAEATARALDHIPETGRMTQGTASTTAIRRPRKGTAAALLNPRHLLLRSTRRFVQSSAVQWSTLAQQQVLILFSNLLALLLLPVGGIELFIEGINFCPFGS